MAITSEDVVENGAQVVEQVNKLAEQMIVFQERLDGIGGIFDELEDKMDEKEDDLKASFESLVDEITGDSMERVKKVGEVLEDNIKTPCIEQLNGYKETLQTTFSKAAESSTKVVGQWEEWRDTEMKELMSNIKEQSETSAGQVNDLISAFTDDIEMVGDVADDYMSKTTDMLGELTEFVNESVSNLNTEREKYQDIMVDSFSNELTESLTNGYSMLKDIQNVSTEQVFDELGEQFDEHVKSQLIPLIDSLVDKVGSSVDEMLEDITTIGDSAGDKTEALDAVTTVLEGMISPIKDIIDRTQSIKDVVDVFI